MMEELELVVAEEYNFAKGGRKKVAFFGNFELSRHGCNNYKSTIFPSETSLQLNFFDADHDRKDSDCSFGEI